MSSRTARTSLLAFLLIVGAAGAYLGFDVGRRHDGVFAHERDTVARLDAMLTSVNELAVTQRGYFEPGRDGSGGSALQFRRVRELADELNEHLRVLRSQLTAPEAIEQTVTLATALDNFSTTDTRVRANLANETYFSAADLVFSASATELRSVTTALITLKGIATSEAIAQYRSLKQRATLVASTVGLIWTIGLLALVARVTGGRVEAASEAVHPTGDVDVTPAPPVVETPAPPPVDLAAVARVCTAMAGATSAVALREILADAAATIEGSGMVLWLGAGEELFPVLGHGYDPRMLSRIGPLARQAENATVTAWRTAHTQVVAGSGGQPGAIVVPLAGAEGCIGVLSAEVKSGRETDTAVQAAITLFAAQLSTIVAAWPEPGTTAIEAAGSETDTIAVTQ